MDINSLIVIIIGLVVIYLFIKFIVSPAIKTILGIITFLVLIYILQRFFNFNIDNVLAPFGINLNLNRFAGSLFWLVSPINYYIDRIMVFLRFIWSNVPKQNLK